MKIALDLTPRMIGHRVRIEDTAMAVEGILSDLSVDVDQEGPMQTLGGKTLRDRTYHLCGIRATVGGHRLFLLGSESLEEL